MIRQTGSRSPALSSENGLLFSDILMHRQMRDKSRSMLAASAGQHTVKNGCKSSDNTREDAIFTQIKHKQEEH
ncbi:hypothetical protein GOP47_0015543, partial [Adiantum capillus-veneris]